MRDARGQETANPTCAAEEDASMRASLNYVDVSPYGAAQDCRNCEFWLAEAPGEACGGCTLISGPIGPLAYCDAWALAAGAAAQPSAAPATDSAQAGGQ
jgi:hypothetical protein